jgi:hypothetical protein
MVVFFFLTCELLFLYTCLKCKILFWLNTCTPFAGQSFKYHLANSVVGCGLALVLVDALLCSNIMYNALAQGIWPQKTTMH